MSDQTIVEIEWWGFSSEHGWVLLDRNKPNNRPGKKGNYTFLRCRDWVEYEENYKNWQAPHYIFSKQYFINLTGSKASEEKRILQKLKDEYRSRKEELYLSLVQKRHKQFLENAGLATSEIRKAKGRHRTNNCWNCGQLVDNSIHLECLTCGWIICDSCGACGCARRESTGANHCLKNDESQVPLPTSVFQSLEEAKQYAKEKPGSKLSRINNGSAWKVE